MSLPRYESYKDSGIEWLGEVPKHWNIVKLKQIASIQNGRDYKHIETELNGYPVIGSGGTFTRASEFIYSGESVLLGRKGTINKPLYINESFWAVDTMFYTKINPQYSAKYLYYCSLTIHFDYYSTSTALPSMTQESLGNIFFAISSLDEQQKIAQFLDQETTKIDNLIAEQQQLIKLLKEKRQAVISHAVTKGLNPDVLMKDSGVEWLGEVPEHWGIVRLRYLCKIETGDADTVDSNEDGAYPFFVRSPNIEKINRYTHDCEAILTAGDGVGVGKVFHYFDGKFCAHQRVYIFRQFEGVQGKFFFHYLKELFLRVVLEGTAKSTVDSLRRPMIADFLMTVPYIEEQSKITKFLDQETAKIDNLIAESTNLISLSKERRSALISSAVTGKIDVRNFVPSQSQVEAMA